MLGLSPMGIHFTHPPSNQPGSPFHLFCASIALLLLLPRELFTAQLIMNWQEWPSDRSTSQHLGISFVSWIPTKHERSSDMLMKFLEWRNHMLLSNSKPKLIAYGNMAPREVKTGKTKVCIGSEQKSFRDWEAITALEATIVQKKVSLFPLKFKTYLTYIVLTLGFRFIAV